MSSIPEWQAHRFLGWFKTYEQPSQAVQSTSGMVSTDSSLDYAALSIYAHWQLPTSIEFNASANGGEMPSIWDPPLYYAGQPFNELPVPTHVSLNFDGWFTEISGGTRITIASNVSSDANTTLYAQYANESFSLLDLGQEWELNASLNPDSSIYDGCY